MTKRKPKKDHKKSGRPTKMTTETLAKLEYAFMRGCTDREACMYAEISEDALYDYQNKNPKYSDRKEVLKSTPSMNARLNLADSIAKKDNHASMWWLERKNKQEFSTRSEVGAEVEIKEIQLKYVN